MMARSPQHPVPAAAPPPPAPHRTAARSLAPMTVLVAILIAWPAIAPAQQAPGAADPRLRAVTSTVERELREDNHLRAYRTAEQGIDDLLQAGPAAVDHAAVGRLLQYLALAAAGRRLFDDAAWSWSLAQSFDPSLTAEQHGLWGEEGEFLAARPARPPARDGDVVPEAAAAGRPTVNLFAAPAGVETSLPDEQDVPPPPYPPALRGSGIEGTVMLQVRIDRRSRTNDPVILESPHPILALAAAQQVKEWRYRPAEVDGQKVDVYYSVRLDFRAE